MFLTILSFPLLFFFCSPPRAESRTGEVSGSGKTEASSQENGTPISEGELVNTSLCRLTTKSFVITYFILVFAPYRSCQWCDRFFPTRLNHRSREGGEEGGRGGRGGRRAECCRIETSAPTQARHHTASGPLIIHLVVQAVHLTNDFIQ